MGKMFKIKKMVLILTAVIGVNSWAADITPVAVACSAPVKGFGDFFIDMLGEGLAEAEIREAR